METIYNERVTKTEQMYRACIVAARSIAIPVAIFGFIGLSQAGHGVNWRLVFSWETVWLISFFGYAVFMILPIDRLSSILFWVSVLVGTILAVGSIWTTRVLYQGLTVDLFDKQIIFRIMIWLLLVPVYLYIPILILKKRNETAKRMACGILGTVR